MGMKPLKKAMEKHTPHKNTHQVPFKIKANQ